MVALLRIMVLVIVLLIMANFAVGLFDALIHP